MKNRNYNNNIKKNCKPEFPDPAAAVDGVCGPTVIPFLPPLHDVLSVEFVTARADGRAVASPSSVSSVGDTTNRTRRLFAR